MLNFEVQLSWTVFRVVVKKEKDVAPTSFFF